MTERAVRVRVGTASRAVAGAALVLLLASGCSTAHRAVRPPAARPPVAVAARLVLEPLDLSPDGEQRLLVRIVYRDAAGGVVRIPPGGNVDVLASRGSVQWQPRVRYGGPAAIVRLTEPGPLTIRVASDLPRVPRRMSVATDTRAWRLPNATARALGPYAVAVGWFPRVAAGTVRIVRADAGDVRVVARVTAPSSSYLDTGVTPGAHFTYIVDRPGADSVEIGVDVPAALPASGLDAIRGKAVWLSFDGSRRWNVGAMLDLARAAGIRAVLVRLAYGETALVPSGQRAALDRFIDEAARRGIAVIGWTVPRALSFEDLAAAVAVAAYRTPNGAGVDGLAVDLERGSEFFAGAGADGAPLAAYLARLRAAVGPRVLLVATIEDPDLERLPDGAIPYAALARSADVLQPMTYWRIRPAGRSTAGGAAQIARSVAAVRRLAGPAVAIDVGAQTADLGNRSGAPPPADVAASIVAARRLGALGTTFFDWDATTPEQWAAIAAVPWPVTGASASEEHSRATPKPGRTGVAGGS